MTHISDDKIHFRIDMPEWIKYRQDDHFTIKAIRAIVDTHPEPENALTEATDQDTSAKDDGDDVHEISDTMVWARRKSTTKRRGYEYKVLWRGFPITEAKHVHEADISGSLVSQYDTECPRGSVRNDHATDIDQYLKLHPGLLNLWSSTVQADDGIVSHADTVGGAGGARGAGGAGLDLRKVYCCALRR